MYLARQRPDYVDDYHPVQAGITGRISSKKGGLYPAIRDTSVHQSIMPGGSQIS